MCVVLSSKGYPGTYEKGKEITGLIDAGTVKDAMVFHAGTALKDGKVVTSGGRVLGITAMAGTIKAAIDRAYQVVRLISFEGKHYRSDIGGKALQKR